MQAVQIPGAKALLRRVGKPNGFLFAVSFVAIAIVFAVVAAAAVVGTAVFFVPAPGTAGFWAVGLGLALGIVVGMFFVVRRLWWASSDLHAAAGEGGPWRVLLLVGIGTACLGAVLQSALPALVPGLPRQPAFAISTAVMVASIIPLGMVTRRDRKLLRGLADAAGLQVQHKKRHIQLSPQILFSVLFNFYEDYDEALSKFPAGGAYFKPTTPTATQAGAPRASPGVPQSSPNAPSAYPPPARVTTVGRMSADTLARRTTGGSAHVEAVRATTCPQCGDGVAPIYAGAFGTVVQCVGCGSRRQVAI